jgi:hypothetical protein
MQLSTFAQPLPLTMASTSQDLQPPPPDQQQQQPTSSYIDYAPLTAATFTPQTYANALLLQTSNPTDPPPLDLSTPLSRVLFDVQEIDTHIDSLTTSHAGAIINDTKQKNDDATKILEGVEQQVRSLEEGYRRLQVEVTERWEKAEEVRVAVERLARTLRVGRAVGRCLQLGRQVEGLLGEVSGREGGGGAGRGMVELARTLLEFRSVMVEEGEKLGLQRVAAVQGVRSEVVGPAERMVVQRAQGVVGGFSMSSLLSSSNSPSSGAGSSATGAQAQGAHQTYAQTEDTKTRATSALQTLYLLSACKSGTEKEDFEPSLLVQALQTYLQTAVTSSLASLARALATLPTLERALLEISARCQNIVALEALLGSINPPAHPLLDREDDDGKPREDNNTKHNNFLTPLLRHLDTQSLPSYFWRSLSAQLPARVTEILSRGGVSARTLRTNKDRVRDAIRQCVDRGSRLPVNLSGRKDEGVRKVGGWEREAAVMVGAVVGPIERGVGSGGMGEVLRG